MKLLLLPGMDGTGDLFQFFTPHLPSVLQPQVVRYPTDRFLDYPQLLDYVREAAPTDEPYVIFAESMSTPLAVQFAATHPRGLAAVILCVGFVTSPVGQWARRVPGALARLFFGMPTTEIMCRHYLAGPGAPLQMVQAVRSATGRVAPSVMAERLRIILDCDARAALRDVTVPMMYLQADGDNLVGARCGAEIIAHRPQTDLVQLRGPHLLAQREPHQTADAVLAFLRRHGL